MTLDPAVLQALAPHGVLRACLNLGNPILANTDKTTAEPGGVPVDLARAFARRLGLGLERVVFDTVGQ